MAPWGTALCFCKIDRLKRLLLTLQCSWRKHQQACVASTCGLHPQQWSWQTEGTSSRGGRVLAKHSLCSCTGISMKINCPLRWRPCQTSHKSDLPDGLAMLYKLTICHCIFSDQQNADQEECNIVHILLSRQLICSL